MPLCLYCFTYIFMYHILLYFTPCKVVISGLCIFHVSYSSHFDIIEHHEFRYLVLVDSLVYYMFSWAGGIIDLIIALLSNSHWFLNNEAFVLHIFCNNFLFCLCMYILVSYRCPFPLVWSKWSFLTNGIR